MDKRNIVVEVYLYLLMSVYTFDQNMEDRAIKPLSTDDVEVFSHISYLRGV